MSLAKKSFGQHFLQDEQQIARILEAAEIRADDLVVEVGPGQGALTKGLVGQGRGLHLVELDRDLLPALRERYPAATLHEADAAKLNFADFVTEPWVFVSNLPYNAGNAILMNVLETQPSTRRIVIMVQKEVGERMCFADSSSRGVLGLAVQSYAQVDKVWIVPPTAFRPAPQVDSMVLVLTPRQLSTEQQSLAKDLISLGKKAFAHRRQQLRKTYPAAADALSKLGLSPMARPQELSLENWQELQAILLKKS